MREFADGDGEDGGDEGHGEEDCCDDGEDHYRLALAAGEGCLVSGEAGFEGVGVLLFEVEEVG